MVVRFVRVCAAHYIPLRIHPRQVTPTSHLQVSAMVSLQQLHRCSPYKLKICYWQIVKNYWLEIFTYIFFCGIQYIEIQANKLSAISCQPIYNRYI